MKTRRIITTRTLLREFPKIKKILLEDRIDSVVVPIDQVNQLEIRLRKSKNTARDLVAAIKKMPKINIKPNRTFDEFPFRPSN